MDKIRSLIVLALSDMNYTQAGILAVQLQQMEMGRSERFGERASRTVVIDGHEFVTLAEPVRYHAGKKYQRPSAPIAEIDFITASWRRAVLQLPEGHRNWIMFAYGNELNYQCQTAICFYLWEKFQELHVASGFKKMKAPTREIMRRLTFYTIQEVRYGLLGVNNINKEESAEDVKMSALLNVSVKCWQKFYKKRWQLMKQVCFNLDELSLLLTAEIRNEQIACNRNGSACLPVSPDMAQEARSAAR